MSTLYTITVKNESQKTQNFFFFQKPATYVGGSKIYSNSIYHSELRTYASSGSTLEFQLLTQYYAGAQNQTAPPVVGQPSGTTNVIQPINLSPNDPNSTTMEVDPLGLTPPTAATGVEGGAFRITTPEFNPVTQEYNIGLGVELQDGTSTLSNFVTAQPNTNLDCQPVVTFYVQIGAYTPGVVIDFTESSTNAAVCDATEGATNFEVTYNLDGTWSVTSPPTADNRRSSR